jgi:hypothetical protein
MVVLSAGGVFEVTSDDYFLKRVARSVADLAKRNNP